MKARRVSPGKQINKSEYDAGGGGFLEEYINRRRGAEDTFLERKTGQIKQEYWTFFGKILGGGWTPKGDNMCVACNEIINKRRKR